jgi:MraZ protein
MEEAVQKYLSITSYYGQQVEMDAQARMLIPQILRSAAGLDDEEVAVIGMGNYIAIHNRKRFEQTVLGNKLTQEDKQKLAEITRRKQQV